MKRPAAAILFALLCARPVAAQSGFVGAGYIRSTQRISADPDANVFDTSAGGISLVGGGAISRHVVVGLELDLLQDATRTTTATIRLRDQPTAVTTRYTNRLRTLAAFAGYRANPSGRVSVGVYAGLVFASLRREVASDAPPIVLQERPAPSVFIDRFEAPLVGCDIIVRAARALALVPMLRAHGMRLSDGTFGFAVRAGAGARVTF